ncbi:MAG: TusE/DsrC/DsvC family sulfur relay protein [Proteobacteria bacterium]|nr:TusE/DsrC/DsvC family sulfur relay protein [Pseudomonadota bacterium]
MGLSNEYFRNAPDGWSMENTEAIAKADGISMSDDHWQLINALQEYYSKVEHPNLRQVKDALNEKFHAQGGIKFLHRLVPSGPIAGGCKLAGLEVPAGAIDKSFGSVA